MLIKFGRSAFISIFLCAFIALFFLAPQNAQAKSYSISDTNIQATLNPDGSMDVVEKRTYKFDGSFTFAYQYIESEPDKTKSLGRTTPYILTNFSVCDDQGCYRELSPQERQSADEVRPDQTYYLDTRDGTYYLKWFYRSTTQKSFQIRYTVSNAITMQQDVAEVYWQWIGAKW